MFKLFLLIFSFIATVATNTLANTLPINNQTTAEISNRLPALFTPAGFVFSIWGVIYVLLAYWIWNMLKEYRQTKTLPMSRVLLFVISSIFNISWIFSWHYEYFNYSLIAMFGLLGTLFLLYMTYSSERQLFKQRLPISIYLGWIFVALFANLDYVLTYYEFNGFGMTKPLWTVIYLTIATAIALHFRYHYNDRAIVLVFIWAFFGIMVRHKLDVLFISSVSLFLICVLIVGILYIKKKPSKS